LLFGYAMAEAGYRNLASWSTISAGFAAIALVWLLAGPTMFGGGLWLLASQGRSRPPLWVGGIAALLAGTSLVAGVLTYVVPCSGPS
jgi:hypothetical protein